jgi:hypothetical protein
MKGHDVIATLPLFLVLAGMTAATAGCTTTKLPGGGGYKSAIASSVLRLAMEDGVSQADLSRADGKPVAYSTIGFDDDEVGEYLGMLLRDSLYARGASVQTDAPLRFELQVHTAGVDSQSFYFLPIFENRRALGELQMDLVVWQKNEPINRQRIRTRSKYSESTVLGFFTIPGIYYHEVDGGWEATEVGDWFVEDLIGHTKGVLQEDD